MMQGARRLSDRMGKCLGCPAFGGDSIPSSDQVDKSSPGDFRNESLLVFRHGFIHHFLCELSGLADALLTCPESNGGCGSYSINNWMTSACLAACDFSC